MPGVQSGCKQRISRGIPDARLPPPLKLRRALGCVAPPKLGAGGERGHDDRGRGPTIGLNGILLLLSRSRSEILTMASFGRIALARTTL
jgi:hypothetical protein